MTKKRFVLQDLDILCRVLDNGKPINGIETVHLLNALHEENVKLQARNKYLATKIQRERNSTQKQYTKWEKEAETKIKELLEENEQLKSEIEKLSYANEDLLKEKRQWEKLSDEYAKLYDENAKLKTENEQLKERNNRQAKQLDRLYNLIEEKDWRTLTDILDDFKRCEEQLQREWKCYE